MFIYRAIDPVAIHIGPLKIYWYGISYLLSFAIAWLLAKYRVKKLQLPWHSSFITDFIFYSALGAILGGRIGYLLFYEFTYWSEHPLFLFATWLGGMSFHGGLLGIAVSLFLLARTTKVPFLTIADFAAPLAPLGLALGRMANFINAELWGRVTTLPWGVVFPNAGALPRHPSQLYEALAEGGVLFIILWFYSAKTRIPGRTTALFFLGYGTIRFLCEFFRQPDQHLGFIAFNWLTMGQLLSLPMVLLGMFMLGYKRRSYHLP